MYDQQIRRSFATRLTTDAMLAALYVLLSVFLTVKAPMLEVSWCTLPLFLAAFLFGLPDALSVALVGSFLEQLLSPYGLSITTPLWMLSPILAALAVGTAAYLLRARPSKVDLILALLAGELLLTVANTAALYLDGAIMGYAVAALHVLLPARLLSCAARAVLSCCLIPLLLPPIRRAVGRGGHGSF